MPSPELAVEVPFRDTKETESSVRALHGVPLIDLLEGENKKCAITQDPVSIYSIDRPNGTEYAVVFPALSGHELLRRLVGISKVPAGINGVFVDFDMITHIRVGRLAKDHASGLGGLWEVFSRSLPLQNKVFHGGVYNEKTEEERQQEEKLLERKVQGFEALSQLTPELYKPIMDKERQIIDMLEGKSPVEPQELVDFLNLTAREIAAGRSRKQRITMSVKKVRRQMQGKWSKIPKEEWDSLVLRAARERVVIKKDDPDESNRYFVELLHSFARRKVELPQNTVGISRGLEYFTIPKVGGIKSAGNFGGDVNIIDLAMEQNKAVPGEYFRFPAKVFVDESGNINFAGETPDDVRRELARINKGTIPVTLAVPVVRFFESESGARGFIFNETGHVLPQEVVSEIGERINRTEKSSKPFEKDWISGMVGVDMLVAAHPDIRGKKNDDGDNWNSIWEKDRITMSEVMDQEVKQGEPRQINGPVQVGIIALHAFARYPETFDPFMDNVVAIIKKNENI